MEQDLQKKNAVSRAIQDALELQDPNAQNIPLSNDYMQQRRTAFVSYGTFLEEYWSHFPQALTKGLGTCSITICYCICYANGGFAADPTLVFGEFMGVYH